MGIIERTYGTAKNAPTNELLISSDSHVIEPAIANACHNQPNVASSPPASDPARSGGHVD